MDRLDSKRQRKAKRKLRIRRRIVGTSDCPRVSVFKSNRHLYLQAIDDTAGRTLAAYSSNSDKQHKNTATLITGESIGHNFGTLLKERQIAKAVFDRNGNLYHGVVKAVSIGIRNAGVKI